MFSVCSESSEYLSKIVPVFIAISEIPVAPSVDEAVISSIAFDTFLIEASSCSEVALKFNITPEISSEFFWYDVLELSIIS